LHDISKKDEMKLEQREIEHLQARDQRAQLEWDILKTAAFFAKKI
jgi:hypothetical protein